MSQKRVADIVVAFEELANTKTRHTGLIQTVARLAQQETEAKLKLAATDAQVKKATEEVRVQSADQERESQLRQSALQKKCAELRSEQAVNDATLERVRAVEPVAERARTLQAATGALAARIAELTGQYHDAAKALEELEEQQRGVAGFAQLMRSEAAQAAIAEAGDGAGTARNMARSSQSPAQRCNHY